jgi:hypothetical protein
VDHCRIELDVRPVQTCQFGLTRGELSYDAVKAKFWAGRNRCG